MMSFTDLHIAFETYQDVLELMQMEMKTCQEMIQGAAAPLVSTFRLSYYSLLNLMSRAEGHDSEHVIRHSFHQFQHDKVISAYQLTSN